LKTVLLGLALVLSVGVLADEAIYRMEGPVLPTPRQANGYALAVRDRADGSVEVHVETSLNPIGSRGSYAEVLVGERPPVPRGFILPSSLRPELRPEMDAWSAATAVLAWVSSNLDLVDDDRRPQDAVSVLSRGGGRCSGLANATAALLMGAGFEARTVSGLLINGRDAIPHRWVECRLPGAGWVPTDPTLGWWAITPGHLAFGDAVEPVPKTKIVKPASGELSTLPRSGSTLVRPNRGAELVCRLGNTDEERHAVAWLSRGSDRRQAVLGPEVRFAGLLPGRWLLVVELEGREVERRELNLRSGVVHSYVVRLPSDEIEEVGS
jgi:hypothetical protein